MTIAGFIDQQVRAAGIPIIGVSVGRATDRATWTVQFDPSATTAQQAQAVTLIAGLATDSATLQAADTQEILDDKVIKTLALWCAQHFSLTAAQAKAELITIYKALP